MLTLSPTDSMSAVAGTNNAITYTFFGDAVVASADAFKVLGQGLVANVAGTIFAATAGQQSLIGELYLANNTAIPVTGIKLYVNGTAVGNQITGSFSIPANGTAIIDDTGLSVRDSTGALVGSTSTSSAKNYAARVFARTQWR